MSYRNYYIIGMISILLVVTCITLGVRYNYNNSKKKIEVISETNVIDNRSKNNKNINAEINGITNEYFPKFTEITMGQYNEAFKNGNRLILFTGRHTCDACLTFGPILEKVLENHPNLVLYYIDSAKVDMGGEEYAEFKNSDDNLKDGYTYVPWLILANDSKVLEEEIGVLEYDFVVNLLKTNGFIN